MNAISSRPTRTPLVRSVDLDIGESQEVELCDGKKATVRLLGVEETRDEVLSAVFAARVTVEVTDREGRVGYDFARMTILDRARLSEVADFHKWPLRLHAAYAPTLGIRPGDPVTFKVRAYNTTEGQETWDFGDGSPPVTVQSDGNVDYHAKPGYAVTVHRYTEPGDYLVRVERTDNQGIRAVARLHVQVGGGS
ncbi:MAG: hypothetical protein A3F84_29715 [Candidatus Handelsmanbacteria bacterium RIFCSPLOWO2_12_FULL_64_10]|uniref:PKD domain-containing protein n=1 Tax=Handelsmanbacteria sp. (strain RIFCSPLOWO2_12_FULL_64_10) TaxID=1817868 RepID=A0A1F6D2B9_HANXR|nr:MAG: hypothetical protein A3F84_29715 [Candidatus Handelsmanbacteria bacterium RIFCSPLOWO2_12_FULL_64_10]